MKTSDLARSAVFHLRRRAAPPYQHTQRLLHELKLLVIEVTQRCNLACRHCGSDCARSTTQPDLPLDDAVRVLEEVAAAWDPAGITLMVGGGEPLLYPHLWVLGRRARQLGFRWGMVSNGGLWDDAAFAAAYRAGLGSVSVSLDGPREAHEWLRGSGSFESAVATIRRLVDDGRMGAMDVITCVHPRNLDALDETFEIVRSLAAPGWRLIPISPIGRARGNADLLLDKEGFQELMRKILVYREQERLPVYLSESNYLGPTLDLRVRDHWYFCRAGVHVAGIMVDGSILACANIDRRFAQGNISTDSFVQVWENRFEVFRDRRWMRQGECARCGEWNHCQGNSFHSWDLDAGCPSVCHFHDFALDEVQVDGPPPVRARPVGPRRG